jgi:hypothetical protein
MGVGLIMLEMHPTSNKMVRSVLFILLLLSFSACKKAAKQEDLPWANAYTGNYLFTTINTNWETFYSDTTIYSGSISAQSKPQLKIQNLPTAAVYAYVDDAGNLYDNSSGGHYSFTGKFDSVGNVGIEIHHYYLSTVVKGIRK